MTAAEPLLMNAIEIQQLCKHYGDQQVITDLSLSIRAGESLALIGHNGAGKTTLMKLILGLARPSAGSIELWNQTVSGGARDQRQDIIGFLPESVSFNGGLCGREILRFYSRHKMQSLEQCDQLLELLGLSDAAGRAIRTYSKGMRQRLGLAQALLGKPRLLLLDEPTSGLDPFLRQHFYDIIAERQSMGATILISSHALTEIEAQTDRIAIMKHGRIIIDGSLQQLRAAAGLPVHISVTTIPGHGDDLFKILGVDNRFEKVGTEQIDVLCSSEDKVSLLHRISAEQQLIEDIQVNPPRLDDLYAHFVNGDSLR
jgi:Cu-processing system ATP-binding protein